MKENRIKRFNESEEIPNTSEGSEKSTWDDIFERLVIKGNNFEEFWKECEKIKLEYIEPIKK
jgi:hypothetical protein